MMSLISTATPALQYIQLLLRYSFYVIRHTWCYLFNLIYHDPVILFLLTLIIYFNQCFFSGLCVTRRSSASALSGLQKVNELFSLSLKLLVQHCFLVYSTVDTSHFIPTFLVNLSQDVDLYSFYLFEDTSHLSCSDPQYPKVYRNYHPNV